MSVIDLEELRDLATRAVQAGMDAVRDWSERREEVGARPSVDGIPAHQYVTAADYAAEDIVIGVLRGGDPSTPVVGEVSGGDTRVERVWVLDPVDGTSRAFRI